MHILAFDSAGIKRFVVHKENTLDTPRNDRTAGDGNVYAPRVRHWRTGEWIYPKRCKVLRFRPGKRKRSPRK